LIFFGGNVTDKVSNQKTLYYATPQTTCASALPGETGNTKIAFFTQMLYQCIARIQLVPPWFLQSLWLTTHTERRSSWTVLHTQCMCTNALSSWKKKMS